MNDRIATIGCPIRSDEATSTPSNVQDYDCNTINTNCYNTLKLMQLSILKANICLLSSLFHTLVCLSLDYLTLFALLVIDH